MSPDWIGVVADKDYLFPASWPAWAWAINLGYPVVLWVLYRRRVALATRVRGERALVTALLLMMGAFLVSVPLTEAHVALAVQLQVTRILWVLDAVTLCYVAWWLVDDLAAGAGLRWRAAPVALLVLLAAVRGTYILKVDTPRPLVTRTLPADDWTEAMRFLREQQPKTVHVLADPGHAWMYGSSVRVAAWRDTVLESVKDTAMAIYDRESALRVADRAAALARFADLSDDELRAVAARYHADVLVVDRARAHAFPVLHENARFVVYDIR